VNRQASRFNRLWLRAQIEAEREAKSEMTGARETAFRRPGDITGQMYAKQQAERRYWDEQEARRKAYLDDLAADAYAASRNDETVIDYTVGYDPETHAYQGGGPSNGA
jgi:hypothetical protein